MSDWEKSLMRKHLCLKKIGFRIIKDCVLAKKHDLFHLIRLYPKWLLGHFPQNSMNFKRFTHNSATFFKIHSEYMKS